MAPFVFSETDPEMDRLMREQIMGDPEANGPADVSLLTPDQLLQEARDTASLQPGRALACYQELDRRLSGPRGRFPSEWSY